MKQTSLWKFTDENGTFVADNPQKIRALYFPLANDAAMMSAITPDLKGDIKTGNNAFLMTPTSRVDLTFSQSSRNFWIYTHKGIWSLADTTTPTTLQAGLLYHTLTKTNKKLGLQATITNFVPADNNHAELMLVAIENNSQSPVTITATSAIPIYARSADNLRDHRHVTSLLHRITQNRYGVSVTPVMSFDERGHKKNTTTYFVYGIDSNNHAPIGSFPTLELFLGESSSLNTPQAIYKNAMPKKYSASKLNGKEAIGALRFKTIQLKPKENTVYALVLGISATQQKAAQAFLRYKSITAITEALEKTKTFWKHENNKLRFSTKNIRYDNWLQWVSIQPRLRKIFGCSFLPDFDYGRGGKGWRDLWQDCLTLLLHNPKDTCATMSAYFSGVRIDGTNATIITKQPGMFLSDRNKISRVWMDHGIWPYLTSEQYFNQSGDDTFLFTQCVYFYDSHLCRSQGYTTNYHGDNRLKTKKGATYKGTILEHILVQHLVSFFNVGAHNSIRLENGDWNDGLDMAAEKGESVAFSAFYAHNLKRIARLLEIIKEKKKLSRVRLLKELTVLLDSLHKRIDYNSVAQKKQLLNRYLSSVTYSVSGTQRAISVDSLIADLRRKADWMLTHIQKKEWITIDKTSGFFNGYYDNASKPVAQMHKGAPRMTLTGQVFAIMSGAATDTQVKKIFTAAQRYLKDKKLGGYRLNTDFGGPHFGLGRAFSFSYGDKENGAIFSHMCVIFAYALYMRGFVKEGFAVFNSLYELAANSATSKIYPNLPEYFNLEGRGMYSYLTGSASWYIMTLATQIFGVRGEYGDLVIEPKLVKEQFNHSSEISMKCIFADKKFMIRFLNPHKRGYGTYTIKDVTTPLEYSLFNTKKVVITKDAIAQSKSALIAITLILG